jgi:septum formation topological specificity factor MinE
MDMKKQINIFFIVHYIYVNSNEIKFEIDTNNDEQLEEIHVNVRRGRIIIHCH